MDAPEPLTFGPLGPPEPLRFDDGDDLLELPDKGFTRDALTAGEDAPDPADPYGLIDIGANDEPRRTASKNAKIAAPLGPPPTLDDLNKMIEENADPDQVERLKGIARRAADLASQGIGNMDDIQRKLADELARENDNKWWRKVAGSAGDGAWQLGDGLGRR